MTTAARPAPRIGCAGWSVVAAHRGLLGPGENALARYATRFDCVEINSSFYRSHQAATYEKWAATVPAAFRFAVKAPQALTHELGLRRARDPLEQFLDEIAGLGRKLGGVLIQLPPSFDWDGRVANAFFTLLRFRHDGPVALEPRHASWFAPARDDFYARYRIARVAADPARIPGAGQPGGDASQWRYFRWHGSPRMYYSRYEDAQLAQLAHLAHAATKSTPRRSWVIFDNTAGGHAAGDAARLQAFVHKEKTHA